MGGWNVIVALFDDANGKLRHAEYAIATNDAAEAVKIALAASGGEAAVVTGEMDRPSIDALGLRPGGVAKIVDGAYDPRIRTVTLHLRTPADGSVKATLGAFTLPYFAPTHGRAAVAHGRTIRTGDLPHDREDDLSRRDPACSPR